MIQVTGVIGHNAEKNATRVKGHCVGKCLWMVQIMIVCVKGVVEVIIIIIISSFIRRYPKYCNGAI